MTGFDGPAGSIIVAGPPAPGRPPGHGCTPCAPPVRNAASAACATALVAYPSSVDGPSTEWFTTPVSHEMFWDRYAPSNRWIQLSGRRWAATPSGLACAVKDGDPRVRLPPLATRSSPMSYRIPGPRPTSTTPRSPDSDFSVIRTVTVDPSSLLLSAQLTTLISSPVNQRNRSISCAAELAMSRCASKLLKASGL